MNEGDIILDHRLLGDPYYETDISGIKKLTFEGDAARYVAEILSAARSERARREIVDRYTRILAELPADPSALHRRLDAFALELLNSSAGQS